MAVRNIVVDCDVGIGISAMGTRRRGLDITVSNRAIDQLDDQVDWVITQKDLTERARRHAPHATIYRSPTSSITASIHELVQSLSRAAAGKEPLEVTVESFSEWIADQTQFKGELPQVVGMEPTDNLMTFVERKLFTINTGDIVTAYLGKLRGYRTVREAIEDPVIRSKVRRAMVESGAVLVKRYGFDPHLHAAYIEKILARFANLYLVDEIDRVGRQLLRKLAAGNRLVRPLLGNLEYGLSNEQL